ncbi:hypothetical protein [Bradyrhizobium sp. sBnM-33]|nr:hypothetical protein [Bradyrhizobium sp. sBnM-33]
MTRTIVASEEPVLFIAAVLLFESLFVLPLYFLTKLYFFSRNDGRSSS